MKHSKPQEGARGQALKYYVIYTVVFALMSAAVFATFILKGTSFIWYHDGLRQHLTALSYCGMWLHDSVAGIFSGAGLSLPTFSFGIGYGSDIVGTLNYYAVGDPLNLLAAFVPLEGMPYLYCALIVLRLYLAGLVFSVYVRRMFDPPIAGTLAGALVYAFCGYALYAAVRHPYFANPMIYLPLILLGVERVLKERKPGVFIVALAISAASNFYFFYMLFLFMALYIIMRLVALHFGKSLKQGLRDAFADFGRLVGFGVIGVMIACVVFVPSVLYFLQDTRGGSVAAIPLLYDAEYYRSIMLDFITANWPGQWTRISMVVPAFMAIVLLLVTRGNVQLKVVIVAMVVFLCVPFMGHVFNGFSYVNNRWCFALCFAIACTLAIMWRPMLELEPKKLVALCAATAVYAGAACYLNRGEATFHSVKLLLVLLCLCIAGVFVCALLNRRGSSPALSRLANVGMAVIVCAGLALNGLTYYHPKEGHYISEFLTFSEAKTNLFDEGRAVEGLNAQGDGFARYSESPTLGTSNAGMLVGVSSTKTYWSLCNANVKAYYLAMGIDASSHAGNVWHDLNSLSFSTELANVDNYVTPKDQLKPYGYTGKAIAKEKIRDKKYRIYRNELALPFGYAYESVLDADAFEAMTPAERREAIMQACVVDGDAQGVAATSKVESTSVELPYTMKLGKNVKQEGNSFVVSEADSKVTLEFKGKPKSETMLEFTEIRRVSDEARETAKVKFAFSDGTEQTRKMSLSNPNYAAYQHYHWRTSCPGYSDVPMTSITYIFPEAATYEFEDMKVISQPMTNYEDYVGALSAHALENLDMHYASARTAATTHVSGDITVDKASVLCTAIPYSAGWRAVVDGQEAPALKTNVMFVGAALQPGTHHVEFVYETPGIKVGGALTLAGILLWIAWTVYAAKFRTRRAHGARR